MNINKLICEAEDLLVSPETTDTAHYKILGLIKSLESSANDLLKELEQYRIDYVPDKKESK